MRLFAGDDWAEDHHDVEVMDEAGKVLAKRRLAGGVAGIAQLHELIGRHLGEDADAAEVVIGIETDHGPWVTGAAAGCDGVAGRCSGPRTRPSRRAGGARRRSASGR